MSESIIVHKNLYESHSSRIIKKALQLNVRLQFEWNWELNNFIFDRIKVTEETTCLLQYTCTLQNHKHLACLFVYVSNACKDSVIYVKVTAQK